MNIIEKLFIGASSLGLLMPALAFAQTAQNLIAVIDVVALIVNRIVGISIVFALIYFIWGLYNYIEKDAGDVAKRTEGMHRMTMGVVALFAIISVWGLVRFLQNSLGIQGSSSNLRIEEIPFVGNPGQR